MQSLEVSRSFSKPKRKTLMGLRRSALVEIVLALAVLLVISSFSEGSHRFWDANPHPFWFVVLFVACKYGTKEGLLAAVLSSLALLVFNIPEQVLGQDSYAYALSILKLPLLWLVSAVAFGELRQMHIRERDGLEASLLGSEEREAHIAQSYQWVKQLKDLLELRMAGQLRSSISAYHAAKSMESLSPNEVLAGLEELVGSTLHPEQFSIYSLDKDGFSAVLTHGWAEGDTHTRSIGTASPLYQAVAGNQQTLCVVSPEHERTLGGQGLLAGPLVDRDSGEVVGMLKIEKLGFTDLHLSNIEAFTTICEWAGMAIVNARKYQTAKGDSMVNPDHKLLTSGYFRRFTAFIRSLAERVGFDVSMVTVTLESPEQFDRDTRTRIARALAESVDEVLRNVDLAFDHQENSESYGVVLPATNLKGADVVVDKIRALLAKRAGKISKNAQFSFTTQFVYDKRSKK